jgi:hypothetical protein
MKTHMKSDRRTKLLGSVSLLSVLMLFAPVAYAGGQTAHGSRSNAQSNVPAAEVYLGAAYKFSILTEAGITDVPTSDVTGNVGTSPITGAADHLTCAEVTGTVYSVDVAGPAPCNLKRPAFLTRAVNDMVTAYNDAAARAPNVTELGAGNIGGLTLLPGVYRWSSGVTIPSNIVLKGGYTDVWIFQIAQGLNVGTGVTVSLAGRAQPKRIYWQVAGGVTLSPNSHFEGSILSKTAITMQTAASIEGRLFSQTAATLQMNSVKFPVPIPQ